MAKSAEKKEGILHPVLGMVYDKTQDELNQFDSFREVSQELDEKLESEGIDLDLDLFDPTIMTLKRLIAYQRLRREPTVSIEQAADYLRYRERLRSDIIGYYYNLTEVTEGEKIELRIFTDWLGRDLMKARE